MGEGLMIPLWDLIGQTSSSVAEKIAWQLAVRTLHVYQRPSVSARQSRAA